jgi:SAM-dependent methyltransferase
VTQDAIWDHYQNRQPESFAGSEGRLGYLAHRARRLHPRGRVLDIGIGAGTFEKAALAKGLDAHAIDPSPETVERLRRSMNLGDKARVGRIAEIPFEAEVFDAVVASEVFEHLEPEDLATGLKEIRRVLRPGGVLLGTVPARERLEDQRVVCPDCGHLFHRWGHTRSFTPEAIQSLLTVDFRVREVVERPFVAWRAPSWRGGFLTVIKWSLWKVGIHTSGESIFFLAERPADAKSR